MTKVDIFFFYLSSLGGFFYPYFFSTLLFLENIFDLG